MYVCNLQRVNTKQSLCFTPKVNVFISAIITTSFEITVFTMPLSKEETQRQTILQLCNNGIRQTSIPLSTVYDNIKCRHTFSA